jgi:hypothetical protein
MVMGEKEGSDNGPAALLRIKRHVRRPELDESYLNSGEAVRLEDPKMD